jgi:hypothetical protein
VSARDFCVWLEGFLEGRDYAGAPTLAVIRARLSEAVLREANGPDPNMFTIVPHAPMPSIPSIWPMTMPTVVTCGAWLNDLDDAPDALDPFAPDPNPETGLAAKAADSFVWVVLGLVAYVALCCFVGRLLGMARDHFA